MKRILPKGRIFRAIIAATFLMAVTASHLIYASRFDPKDLALADNALFVDRSGAPLRFIPDEKGERHIWISGKKIPETVKAAFISAEDQRFYLHPGFDLAAIARALKNNLLAGQVVSGASTITQQTVRLIYPRKKTYRDKFIEILRAVRMELALTKEEILEQYLNRVPMGNNIVGVELAARTYFGKSTGKLSAAEAALLASIPKSPGRLNPYAKDVARLTERKDWVLLKMREAGHSTEQEFTNAISEPLIFLPPVFPNHAPHLVDLFVKRGAGARGKTRTTIDLEIQKGVERIIASHAARLSGRGAHQASAMLIDNSTMEVLALTGSISYEAKDMGFNNGATALRSAGSTLKPFIYAQALDDGFSVTWLLEDTLKKYKTPKGDYSPVNFDRTEYGPVTMRNALGNSLNISAVRMLETVGQERYYLVLKEIGFMGGETKTSEHYGLGLVIGNPEVALDELVEAYAMLANGGVQRPLRYTIDDSPENAQYERNRVFSSEAAFIVSDILSDASARFVSFGNAESMRYPFRVSVKTGTSTKYRDAWAIGYTPEYTAGVWAGNFEGEPTFNLSGAEGAAPILNDIIGFLYKNRTPSMRETPEGIVSAKVCGISGMKPGRYCRHAVTEFFIKDNVPATVCSFHTNDEASHKLPTTYASWVYDKKRRGTAGKYTLRGLSEGLDEIQNGYSLSRANGITGGRHYSIGSAGAKGQGSVTDGKSKAKITYPHHGDGFVMVKDGADQSIKLEAVSAEPLRYLDWFIDGELYKRSMPPYRAFWKPERGWHTISILSPDNTGDSIRIKIE